jgi:undecaprenyl-phosphate 4-deoxy-4-formamido-L-arabinose transferase
MKMRTMSSRRSAGSPDASPGNPGLRPDVSAVVPVHDEEPNLQELHDRLERALDSTGRPWEIVYVDDGSTDGSLEFLAAVADKDLRVRVVEFNRNYGQHAAVFAGFAASRGEIVVTLDADLQNPPEEIPRLVAQMDRGFDVVGTRRRDRKDPLFRRLASRAVNRITGGDMTDYGCMLRAYRRHVVDQIGQCRELSSFIPVLANLYAKKIVEIDVEHAERRRGTSKYGLRQLIKLQFDLVTGFSQLPLKLMTGFGALVAACSFGLGLFLLAMRILKGSEWAQFGVFTLFAVLFLMVGLMFVAMGILGEYIGRIYGEVRQRPRYVIRKIHGGTTP